MARAAKMVAAGLLVIVMAIGAVVQWLIAKAEDRWGMT